jgi:spore coat protein U-like protein
MGTAKNVRALGVVLAASGALVFGVGMSSTNGKAASVQGQMPVKLTVEAQCQVTANELNFGTVTFLQNNIDQSTTFRVRCTKNVAYSVRLLGGSNYAGSTRNLKNAGVTPAENIAYALYQDAARTLPWDPNASVDKNKNGTATYDVFGRIQAQPNADFSPGSFEDTVTIQVDY